jgi:hypothetical protein
MASMGYADRVWLGFSLDLAMGYGFLESYGIFTSNGVGGHPKPAGYGSSRVWFMTVRAKTDLITREFV